jgi:penicillin-binding protein 1C
MAKNPFPLERLEALPQSAVLSDRKGRPLARSLTVDEQWRLPVPLEDISPWLRQATIAVEDERFNKHSGVDFISVSRACLQNLFAGGVVSGASTLDMQLCRMLDPRPRTLEAKLSEAARAWQAKAFLSKGEVLEAYLNLAPYGGNLQGAEAASLRYFGKSAKELSLPEAALLAGIPQSPARLRPDRYPEAGLNWSLDCCLGNRPGILLRRPFRPVRREGVPFWIPDCRPKSSNWPVNAFWACRLVRTWRLW